MFFASRNLFFKAVTFLFIAVSFSIAQEQEFPESFVRCDVMIRPHVTQVSVNQLQIGTIACRLNRISNTKLRKHIENLGPIPKILKYEFVSNVEVSPILKLPNVQNNLVFLEVEGGWDFLPKKLPSVTQLFLYDENKQRPIDFIERFPNVEHLRCNGIKKTEAATVAKQNLAIFENTQTDLTTTPLDVIISAGVTSIEVSRSRLTDSMVQVLNQHPSVQVKLMIDSGSVESGLQNVTSIDFMFGSEQIELAASFRRLASKGKVEAVNLSRCADSPRTLEVLSTFPNLVKLEFKGQCTREEIEVISRLENLRELVLDGNDSETVIELAPIFDLINLRELTLDGGKLNVEMPEEMDGFSSGLKVLNLRNATEPKALLDLLKTNLNGVTYLSLDKRGAIALMEKSFASENLASVSHLKIRLVYPEEVVTTEFLFGLVAKFPTLKTIECPVGIYDVESLRNGLNKR